MKAYKVINKEISSEDKSILEWSMCRNSISGYTPHEGDRHTVDNMVYEIMKVLGSLVLFRLVR